MVTRNLCIHCLSDPALDQLPDLRFVARTHSRQELRDAIGALGVGTVLLDIDMPDALDAVVEILEINPEVGVVGVTGRNDVQHVIAAQRAGCRQITTRPLDPNDLAAAVRRLSSATTDATQHGSVFAVIGSIGGAGATAMSCYLAMELAAHSNSRALLIDLDLDFGGVARLWDMDAKYTIADVASAGTVDRLILQKAAISVANNVDVIARPETIQEGQAIDDTLVAGLIDTARQSYRHVVLDLPRKLDAVAGRAIEMCDKLLVVLQLTVPSLRDTQRLIQGLNSIGLAEDRYEFVINRYRKNVHRLSIDLVEKQVGKKVLAVIPNDYRAVAHAFDVGEPVAANSPFRDAVAELAARLTSGPTREEEPAKGLWSKLGFGRKRTPAAAGA